MIKASKPGAGVAGNHDDPDRTVLEAFCVFALSRMYRWETVALEPGSAGMDLVQRQAAQALSEDSIYVLHGRPATADDIDVRLRTRSLARVRTWFSDRARLEPAEAAYLDLVLFEVDQKARRRLAGAMADPPLRDPVGQVLLMRRSMAVLPDLWASARLTTDSAAVALAVGLDLHPDNMPAICVDPVVAKFPQLAPRAGLPACGFAPHCWISTSNRMPRPAKCD